MKCAICGGKLTKKLIDNPAGLARVDVYYCEDCLVKNQELYIGSKALWKKFQKAIEALSASVDELKGVHEVSQAILKDTEETLNKMRDIVNGGRDE